MSDAPPLQMRFDAFELDDDAVQHVQALRDACARCPTVDADLADRARALAARRPAG